MSAPQRTTPAFPYVGYDDYGNAVIAGTTMKVVELVMAQRAHGWSPEELYFQFPHLKLSQVHSALAYYWDHQAELDEEIVRRGRFADEARLKAGPSPLAARLKKSA